MNGIEKITAQILADAEAQAEGIIAQAKVQAAAAEAELARRAQAEADAIAAAGEQNAARRLERLESAAALECRKNTLAAKQALVDAAFDRALELLTGLPGEEYADLLAKLAVGAAVTGREEIVLSPADRERVGLAVAERANRLLSGGALTLANHTREMAGGLILRDGLVETNCAFEVLLRLKRDEPAAEVAKILFD